MYFCINCEATSFPVPILLPPFTSSSALPHSPLPPWETPRAHTGQHSPFAALQLPWAQKELILNILSFNLPLSRMKWPWSLVNMLEVSLHRQHLDTCSMDCFTSSHFKSQRAVSAPGEELFKLGGWDDKYWGPRGEREGWTKKKSEAREEKSSVGKEISNYTTWPRLTMFLSFLLFPTTLPQHDSFKSWVFNHLFLCACSKVFLLRKVRQCIYGKLHLLFKNKNPQH